MVAKRTAEHDRLLGKNVSADGKNWKVSTTFPTSSFSSSFRPHLLFPLGIFTIASLLLLVSCRRLQNGQTDFWTNPTANWPKRRASLMEDAQEEGHMEKEEEGRPELDEEGRLDEIERKGGEGSTNAVTSNASEVCPTQCVPMFGTMLVEKAGNGTNKNVENPALCDGENMAYPLLLPLGGNNTNCCQIVWGRPFKCSLKWILERMELTDGQQKKRPAEPVGKGLPVFVTAANDAFFPYLRGWIHSVRATFGRRQQIIGYDLGGISGNPTMMDELAKVCNLEWRQFNHSLLPPNVRHLKSFSWKIVIIAEVLRQHPTLIYADTSVHFHSNGFGPFLTAIEQGRIAPWQEISDTGHSIAFATHPSTYSYIPHYWERVAPDGWFRMPQAGFAIVHRSEYTRRMLKWALLCASTLECIDPPGSTIKCNFPFVGKAKCHRQDQSVLAILTNNLEAEALRKDPNFVTHYDARNPWFHEKLFYEIVRRTPLESNVNFVGTVQC